MSALSDLRFPQSLFSNERAIIEQYRCSERQLEDVPTHIYIDGFLAISKEAHLGFIKNPIGNVILEKKQLAFWYAKEKLKGIQTRMWYNGLPLFKVTYNRDIFLTFMPNVQSEHDDYQITLEASKKLYDAMFEVVLPKVIEKMPDNGFTKVMNTTGLECGSYHINGNEFDIFSELFVEELNRQQYDPTLSALRYCKPHFLLKAFGQNLTFNEESKRHFQNLVDGDLCTDCLIHIATDIGHPDYTLLWARDFVQLVFGNAGNVYFSCGFYCSANGDGRVLNGSSGAHEIDDYIRLMKLYNTTFKRLPQIVSQATGITNPRSYFTDPRIAKLLSLQQKGIKQYERLKPEKGKIVGAVREGLISRIIANRLELLSTSDELHKARVELIISLCEEGAWQVIEEHLTGARIVHMIRWLYDFVLGMEATPLYAIPREDFTQLLCSEMKALIRPIDNICESFFQMKRPATPDQLFTIYLCEIVIDFLVHGTKNFLHALKPLDINMKSFQRMNRVSFVGIEFRRQGHSFLLDASSATPSNVYTLAPPVGPNDPEPLTEKLMRVHICGKRMLNKFSVALLLLYEMMEDIHRINMQRRNYRTIHGQTNPHSVFSKAFLRSTTLLFTSTTVSEFVDKLDDLEEDSSSRIPEAVELAREVIEDLDEDNIDGSIELKDGMSVVLNCALKGKLAVEVYAVPRLVASEHLDINNFQPLMPDMSDILIERNPPVFEEKLLKKVLVCVNSTMRELQPFPNGIHQVQPWHLGIIYKVLISDIKDASKVARLIGCAILKHDVRPGIKQKLKLYMDRYRITDALIRKLNMHERDDRFSYDLNQTVNPAERHCLTMLRQLHMSVGLLF